MKKRIEACLLQLCQAIKTFMEGNVLDRKAIEAFESTLQKMSSLLRALGRELLQAQANHGLPLLPAEIEENALFEAQITALMTLRSHAAFGARVARRTRLLAQTVSRYVNGGLVDLATGQQLLGTIAYHGHELKQFHRRCRSIAASEALELIYKNAGKNPAVWLRKIATRLLAAETTWTQKVTDFEKKTVQAGQSFSSSKSAVTSIVPCGMPGMSGLPEATEQIECIAVYRGLHFRRDYFSDFDILNQSLASLDQIPASSEEARHRASVEPGLVESQAQMDQLDEEAMGIARTLRALEGEAVKQHWSGNKQGDQYYSLIQRYINTYGAFSTEIKQADKAPALYRGLDFSLTPFVSFSFNPVHSIRYVLGIKTPEEQSEQRRRQGMMGELYIYLIPLVPDNILRLNNVLQLAAQKSLSIKARILNEAEVNVLGGMSSACLVGRLLVGASGFDFYAPDEEGGDPMKQSKLDNWQEELAARAIGCAASEAQQLGWKIVGYESLPTMSSAALVDPYFGVANMPTEKARLNTAEKQSVQVQRALARKVTAFNKGFSSVGGTAATLSWGAASDEVEVEDGDENGDEDEDPQGPGSGNPDDIVMFEPLQVPSYPKSVTEFLQQQGVQAPHASLANLFDHFNEGQATPEGHNCLIHTLAQLEANDPNVMPDFVQERLTYGLPTGATIDVGTTGHLMAVTRGLHVQIYAIGYGGAVQNMTSVGNAAGTNCTILQFGAHFVPLWPK